jgi:dienelactone hydrolase
MYQQLCKKILKYNFHYILVLLLFISTNQYSNAQNIGCNGVRYLSEVFPNVTTTTVDYGAATTMANVPQTLSMDIFQPSGDTLSRRPVIIWVFGGAFITGSRQSMHELCRLYAKRGYVTAAIDYRLYPISLGNLDSTKLATISIQAMQDLKAAVRYMRRYANMYKVDTTNIIAGGLSAGAITSLLAGHLDATDNVPAWIGNVLTQQGGLEGASGNAGFSSSVKAVVNHSGSLPTTAWLDAGDVPTISYHGTDDNIVPFDCGVGLFNFTSCGSAAISRRLTDLRVPNMFYAVPRGGHTDIYTGATFTDFLNREIAYLKRIVCGETLSVDNKEITHNIISLQTYPNPSQSQMWVSWQAEKIPTTEGGNWQVVVTDAIGRVVFSQTVEAQSEGIWLQKTTCGTGFFIITLRQQGKILANQKIVFN